MVYDSHQAFYLPCTMYTRRSCPCTKKSLPESVWSGIGSSGQCSGCETSPELHPPHPECTMAPAWTAAWPGSEREPRVTWRQRKQYEQWAQHNEEWTKHAGTLELTITFTLCSLTLYHTWQTSLIQVHNIAMNIHKNQNYTIKRSNLTKVRSLVL